MFCNHLIINFGYLGVMRVKNENRIAMNEIVLGMIGM